MYAIIKSGGKQYCVKEGDIIAVEKLRGKPGENIAMDVLMIGGNGTAVGASQLSGASVTAEILGETKGEKIIVFKHKRRKNYRRTRGHRQHYTSVKITKIGAPSRAGSGESHGT